MRVGEIVGLKNQIENKKNKEFELYVIRKTKRKKSLFAKITKKMKIIINKISNKEKKIKHTEMSSFYKKLQTNSTPISWHISQSL